MGKRVLLGREPRRGHGDELWSGVQHVGGLLAAVALGGNVEELDEEDQKYSVAIPLHFLSQQNVSYLAVNTAVGLETDPAQAARPAAALRGSE